MSWFDKLKNLVESNVSFFNSPTSTLKIFSDNKKTVNNINLQINIPTPAAVESKETAKILQQLQNILREAVRSEPEHKLTTEISEKKLQLVSDLGAKHSKINSNHLEFVTNCLPEKDRPLWASALILKSKAEIRDSAAVKSIKFDLISHSNRGKNIANLCSAGYLESEIMPLYDYLVNEIGDKAQFEIIYEQIVTEFPRAVFVNNFTGIEEVVIEIKEKIEILCLAGWTVLNIHAYGENNVKKSLQALVIYQQRNDAKKIEITTKPPRPTHHALITVNIFK